MKKAKKLKEEKKKSQRKDYEKKRNVKRYNEPAPKVILKKTKWVPRKAKGGTVYDSAGERDVAVKVGKRVISAGDGTLPKSRKKVESKKSKSEFRKALENTRANLTANE